MAKKTKRTHVHLEAMRAELASMLDNADPACFFTAILLTKKEAEFNELKAELGVA